MSEQIVPSTAVPCNITEEEREALRIVAKDKGFTSVSKFIRFCIMEQCEAELQAVVNHNRKRRNGELIDCKAG
jgi:hypothetical protein